MCLGSRRRYSTNVDGSVVDHAIVRRGQFLVRPAACRLVLHYSWLACKNRVAFRPSYQVTLSRPLGLSWEEGQEFFGCVMCGSQPRQHHLQSDKEPFDVHLLTKREFCPIKNTLKYPCTLRTFIVASATFSRLNNEGISSLCGITWGWCLLPGGPTALTVG